MLSKTYCSSEKKSFLAKYNKIDLKVCFFFFCFSSQITLAKTLKAVCVLRGFLIEYVNVKAYNEDFLSNDGKV